MNGYTVFRLAVLQCPVNRRHTPVAGKRSVVQIQDSVTLLNEPVFNDFVVENGESEVYSPGLIENVGNVPVVSGFDDLDIVGLRPCGERCSPSRLRNYWNDSH